MKTTVTWIDLNSLIQFFMSDQGTEPLLRLVQERIDQIEEEKCICDRSHKIRPTAGRQPYPKYNERWIGNNDQDVGIKSVFCRQPSPSEPEIREGIP